jgi:hypothetical protein
VLFRIAHKLLCVRVVVPGGTLFCSFVDKIGEPGEKVLSEHSELRNLTPQKVRPLTAAVQVVWPPYRRGTLLARTARSLETVPRTVSPFEKLRFLASQPPGVENT